MLNVDVKGKVFKPIEMVFMTIVNPDMLSKYFISRY